MATRTSSLAPDNNTDANFRLWINEIHNSLIAFGWAQTSDTGQINFSTVTRPSTTNLYQGYAVYKMGDALQSTSPFFIRFDFGTGGNSDAPQIKLNVGLSTDGAGNIVNGIGTQSASGVTSAGSVTLSACRTSGTSSSFRMNFWLCTGLGLGFWLAIERDKDATGADTANGFNVVWALANSGSALIIGSTFFCSDGTFSGIDAGGMYAMVSSNSSQTSGGSTGVGPVRCALGPLRNPMIGLLLTSRTDWTNESTNAITIYGASHTYIMLRTSSTTTNLNRWNADCGLAMLWE